MRHRSVDCWPTATAVHRPTLRSEHAVSPREAKPHQRPSGGTLSARMPEQPIDTRLPGQQFPVGSVVTLLDRHRRTVFPAVAELKRLEAIVGGGETGRWRVRCARLQLIAAGPTDRTRDHRAQPRTRRRVADGRAARRCTAKRCSTVTHS